MEARVYHVSGRVQGVGFRRWTQRVASELRLIGDVRNLPDGTVQVRAAGADTVLDTLERRLHEGPAAAQVDRVEAEAARVPAGAWSGFAIVRE